MFSKVEWSIIAVTLILVYISDVLGGPLVAILAGVIGLLVLVIVLLAREKPPVRAPQDQLPRESKPKRPAA